VIRTGIVTVLFTDVVDSSHLMQRFGDDGADRIRRGHFRALRSLLGRYNGREVKSLGDGLMVVFPSAVSAVSCAIEMQRITLTRNEEDPDRALGVRVGIHAGEPIQEGDDYFGTMVVVARRLCDCAHGGQIEVSDLVRHIVANRGGFHFERLEPITLKGFDLPVHAWEVDWQAAAQDVPATDGEAERPARAARLKQMVPWAIASLAVIAGVVVGAVLNSDRPSTARPPVGEGNEDGARSDPVLVWERGTLAGTGLPTPGDQLVRRMLVVGERLYAVGEDDGDAAVWVSRNGSEWQRVSDRAFGGAGDQVARGISGSRGRLVVVGTESTDGVTTDAAVWISDDGEDWKRTDEGSPELEAFGSQLMNRVLVTSNGSFLAVGHEEEVYDDLDGAAWVSRNGRRWARIDDDSFGGDGLQELRGVETNDRRIVAVGRAEVEGQLGAAAWRSRDGRDWKISDDDDLGTLDGHAAQLMSAIVWGRKTFVAVGRDTARGGYDAAVWGSPNGRVWETLSLNGEVFGGDGNQELWGIVLTTEGWFAVGSSDDGTGADAVVWHSTSLDEWERLTSDEEVLGGDGDQVMRWAAEFRGDLVGAGWQQTAEGYDPAFWHADLGS